VVPKLLDQRVLSRYVTFICIDDLVALSKIPYHSKMLTVSVEEILPDGTASLHSHPVRNGLVLLLLDSQGSLGAEGLLRRLH
jgi:hypothetical protein